MSPPPPPRECKDDACDAESACDFLPYEFFFFQSHSEWLRLLWLSIAISPFYAREKEPIMPRLARDLGLGIPSEPLVTRLHVEGAARRGEARGWGDGHALGHSCGRGGGREGHLRRQPATGKCTSSFGGRKRGCTDMTRHVRVILTTVLKIRSHFSDDWL